MSPLLCPPEQKDACSQWEGGMASTYGGSKPGGVLRTEPGRKELGKQKRVESSYGCYHLFIHVFFIKEEMSV